MANEYLKPQIPLKDLNSENYFYPLTTSDQIIVTQSRLSAFMNESNNNLLNLTNIGTITSTGKFNLNGDLEIPNNHSFIGILGSNSSTDYTNVGGLTWFNFNGTAGAAANVNDTPTSAWWYIIRNRHTNTGNNCYTDLAIPFNSPSIYYKRVTGNYGSESIQGNKWVKVLDEDNYSPTLDTRYVTLGTTQTISGQKTFTNTITGDILSAWHVLAGRPSNTTNFRTYFETVANLHHDNPNRTDSEMSYNRWFASNSDQTTYGPSALNLPVVDQHVLSFGIDDYATYSRHIALDIRTNKMFLGGRVNNTWQAWSEVIVHDLAQTISGQKTFTSLVKINTNGNTVTIGSANTSWCHFENSANIPFYFNHQIQVNGDYKIYNNNTIYAAGRIELYTGTPYIDFHFNNSTADYTSRIIEAVSGTLRFDKNLQVQGTSTFNGQAYFNGHMNWKVGTNFYCNGVTANNQEWSFDMNSGSHTGCYWHVWSAKNNASCLQCFNDDRHSWAFKLYGAVWNDYAEFRETKQEIEPGRCIIETGKGDLILSTKRLQEGCEIVSDTFGFAIGQSKQCNTPTAASGRVLAYPYEDKYLFKPGKPVCSGPNGTISIMTDEEARLYPWCIIGTVSEIPNYEEWQCGDEKTTPLKVNGRIWIRIR